MLFMNMMRSPAGNVCLQGRLHAECITNIVFVQDIQDLQVRLLFVLPQFIPVPKPLFAGDTTCVALKGMCAVRIMFASEYLRPPVQGHAYMAVLIFMQTCAMDSDFVCLGALPSCRQLGL